MPNVMFTKAAGSVIELKATENTYIWMALLTKANGKPITSMDTAKKRGLTVRATKETIFKVKNTVLDFSNGLTAPNTVVSS